MGRRRSKRRNKNWKDVPQWKKGILITRPEFSKIMLIMALAFLFASGLLILQFPEMMRQQNYLAIGVSLLFPMATLILTYRVILAYMMFLKYPVVKLNLVTNPGVIGGKFKGELLLPEKLQQATNIKLVLTNVHQRRVRSSEGGTHLVQEILWNRHKFYKKGDWDMSQKEATLPVEFVIDSDTKEADKNDLDDSYLWHLDVEADVPGIDFKGTFDLPVFKTADSRPDVVSVIDEPEDVQYVLDHPPTIKGVIIKNTVEGLYFKVKPFRLLKAGFVNLILLIICGVATNYFIRMYIYGALIPGLFSLFFLYGTIYFFLRQTELEIKGTKGIIKNTFMGLGYVHEFDLKDIETFKHDANEAMKYKGHEQSHYHSLEIVTTSGKTLKTGEISRKYEDMVWLSGRLNQFLDQVKMKI